MIIRLVLSDFRCKGRGERLEYIFLWIELGRKIVN